MNVFDDCYGYDYYYYYETDKIALALCFLKVDKIVHEHDREKINKNENWFVSFFFWFSD